MLDVMHLGGKGSVHGSAILATMLAAMSIVFSGCRTTDRTDFPRIINEPAPLAEATRRGFGVVGVLPVAMATNVHWYPPKNRPEAFERIAGKTWNGLSHFVEWKGTFDKDDLAADGITLGFITLVSLTAGAAGAFAVGVPEERFRQCDANLRRALKEEPFDAGIQNQIGKLLAKRSLTNVHLLPEAALTNIKLHGEKPDLSIFAAQGINSILDIRVSEIGFELESGINPEVAFAPEVGIYLIRVSDGKVQHASYLNYRGKKRPFTAWADKNARPFRAEMTSAERQFARAILEQYFAAGSVRSREP
jgi:hypothetical protein